MNFQELRVFFTALKLETYIFLQDIFNNLIDNFIWVCLSVFANGYILPALGVTSQFGSLIAIGAIVSCGAFQTFSLSLNLVSDFCGDRTINYRLMLPMRSWLVFLKIALAWSVKVMILAIGIIPVAKLILWSRLDLSNFNFFLFPIVFMQICFFAGAAAVFSSSIPDNMLNVDRVWVRYIFPLWFLGGSIFPYEAVMRSFPKFGWILIFNPFVHATEAIKATVLGSGTYFLPLFVTIPMMMVFTCLTFGFGLRRLRRKLDFI